MKLQELADVLEIDVQGSLADRFMNSEALYARFLKKLLADENMAGLEAAVAALDLPAAEQRAHALKGVCANLGLTGLQASFALIVNMVRKNEADAASLAQALARAKAQYELAQKYISQLE